MILRESFQEEGGKVSSMRLMSFIALGVTSFLACADVFTEADVKSEIILYFLVASFVPKAVQKFAERAP